MTATLDRPRPAASPPPRPRPGPPPAPAGDRGSTREDRRAAAAAAAATLLGSFSLAPVFTTAAWLRPVLAVVLAVWAAGLLLRHGIPALWATATGGRPVPRGLGTMGAVAVPVAQAFLVACVLTALYAPADAWAGVVPTPTSVLALNEVLVDGTAELQEQATPALPLTGLLALTALLVGIIALAVDLLAVTARQAAFAGVGLLVLYCIPVSTVTGSIGLAALVAPAVGFVLLLWADQRRRLAGRGRRAARAGTGTGARAAVRIGLFALATGLVLGAFVPTLPEGSFGSGLGGGAGGGGSTGTALDPVATLEGQLNLPDPIDLLEVEGDVDRLGHLRSVSLDQYDPDAGWTMSNLDGETSVAEPSLSPVPPGLTTRDVEVRISAREHADRFLPVPWAPQRVQVTDPENWRYDPSTGTVFGRETTTSRRTWFVSADQPAPTAGLLQDSPALGNADPVRQRFTQLPELAPEVTDLVTEVTAGASTPYERVRAINDFLTDRDNGFVYSLSTTLGTSDDDLVNFLELRRGFCEQYAGAMAVMVRAAGVPARVVLGYTPGELRDDGTRMITTDDAHAWVEAYFAGLGWVAFDPTPIAQERAVALPWAPRAEDEPAATPDGADPTAQPSQAPAPREDRGATQIPELAVQEGGGGLLPSLLAGTGVALAVVAVVAVPGVVRAGQRRRRIADGEPGMLWDELGASVRDLGLPLDPALTPRQASRHLAEQAGHAPDPLLASAAADALRELASAEEAASYGPSRTGSPADAERAEHLKEQLLTAERALRHSVPAPTRLRAVLWPTSLVADVAARSAALPGRLTAPFRSPEAPRASG
jgi:transglutaminase-like putative cysteine protease